MVRAHQQGTHVLLVLFCGLMACSEEPTPSRPPDAPIESQPGSVPDPSTPSDDVPSSPQDPDQADPTDPASDVSSPSDPSVPSDDPSSANEDAPADPTDPDETTTDDPPPPIEPPVIDDGYVTDCNDDVEFFSNELWPTVLEPRCAGCHQSGSLAENSAMVFARMPTPAEHVENFNTALSLATTLEEGESLLLRKPTGQATNGHGGGALIGENSIEYELLRLFVRRGLDLDPCPDETPDPSDPSTPVEPSTITNPIDPSDDATDSSDPVTVEPPSLDELPPGRRLIRRLSHDEYDKSLEVVLGASTDAAGMLAADNVVNGYANNADALTVSPLLAAQYAEIAEELGQRVAYLTPEYTDCHGSNTGAACFRQLLLSFGTQLFRRPLSESEMQRYFDFWYQIATEDGVFEATSWTFSALLQSPNFLYRTELGSKEGSQYTLTNYEIASQLAFLIAGMPPDEPLMDAAAAGELSTAAGRHVHAERLLETSEGASHFGSFLAAWLELGTLSTVARNTDLYPEFSPGIRTDMLKQTLKTAESWLQGNAEFATLFTSDTAHLNQNLTAFYDVAPSNAAADSEGFKPTQLGDRYPAGILSHGSTLATYAKASASSPIHRGVLVRERFLCQELAPPPPNLDTSPPAVDPNQSTRERYTEHSSNPSCSSCHDLIDPIGFGFEHYDAVGRWRAKDGVHTIDASGEILYSPSSDGNFDGLAELGGLLASSADVEACFIEQWSEYLFGLHHDPSFEPSVDALIEHFHATDKTLKPTLQRFTELPHISRRQMDSDVEQETIAGYETPLSVAELLQGRPDFGESSSPTPEEPTPVNGTFSVESSEASRWDSGACFDVNVTNTSSADQVWEVVIDLEGTVNNIWNAQIASQSGSRATVVGLSWNATLAPQGSASFGYCVGF